MEAARSRPWTTARRLLIVLVGLGAPNQPFLLAREPRHMTEICYQIRARGFGSTMSVQGQPVMVLEGAPSFGAIGYGIQFGPNVFHVLDRIGMSNAVLEKADSPPAVLMIDAQR
jgi:hypothetical protein